MDGDAKRLAASPRERDARANELCECERGLVPSWLCRGWRCYASEVGTCSDFQDFLPGDRARGADCLCMVRAWGDEEHEIPEEPRGGTRYRPLLCQEGPGNLPFQWLNVPPTPRGGWKAVEPHHERSERLHRAAKDVEVRAKIAEGGLSAL